MTSPDLIHELRASRPAAPTALRALVREIAAKEAAPQASFWPQLRLPLRRIALVAVPAAAAIAIASSAVLGLARSDGASPQALRDEQLQADKGAVPESAAPTATDTFGTTRGQLAPAQPADDRAQRISATLTVEVDDSEGVSQAAQQALDLTSRLGGHVVSSSVVTAEGANAAITVRVPATRVQEAIMQLSALGEIVSQQVTIDDLQETLDELERRTRSLRAQITSLVARLESDSLDAEPRARLEARLKNLRIDYRVLRGSIAGTNAEARMSTIQLAVVTPDSHGGAAAPPARLDRTLDEALNVLVWEGVVALAIAIVVAPFVLLVLAMWLGRKFYRRREEDRLLAT